MRSIPNSRATLRALGVARTFPPSCTTGAWVATTGASTVATSSTFGAGSAAGALATLSATTSPSAPI